MAEDPSTRRARRRDFREGLAPAERSKRFDGQYFYHVDELWAKSDPVEVREVSIKFYNDVARTDEQGQHLYPETVDHIENDMASSVRSSTINTNQTGDGRLDMFDNSPAQAAHLISHVDLCHRAYGFLAEAATGKKKVGERTNTKEDRLKLLNGIKASDGNRMKHTGLKHHMYNKMYLDRQQDYFDGGSPNIIIIPLLPLCDVLNWNGKDEYDVMAVTCGDQYTAWECAEHLLVYAQSCGQEEVDRGRNLLETFVKAIASSVVHHDVTESFTDPNPPNKELKLWLQRTEMLKKGNLRIFLPRPIASVNLTDRGVAKGSMSLRTSLPDPFLVAVKAAVNYSAHCGCKLMPSCPNWDSETSSDGEVNTLQGVEIGVDGTRDFSSIAASLAKTDRHTVELFSAD
jgi:hypothetical protein